MWAEYPFKILLKQTSHHLAVVASISYENQIISFWLHCISDSTEATMKDALVNVLQNWEIPLQCVIGMAWNTTASNSGVHQGPVTLVLMACLEAPHCRTSHKRCRPENWQLGWLVWNLIRHWQTMKYHKYGQSLFLAHIQVFGMDITSTLVIITAYVTLNCAQWLGHQKVALWKDGVWPTQPEDHISVPHESRAHPRHSFWCMGVPYNTLERTMTEAWSSLKKRTMRETWSSMKKTLQRGNAL